MKAKKTKKKPPVKKEISGAMLIGLAVFGLLAYQYGKNAEKENQKTAKSKKPKKKK